MAWRIWRKASRKSSSRCRLMLLRTIGTAAAVRIDKTVMTMMISSSVKPRWRFWILDFGFSIEETVPCEDRLRLASAIQNLKSKIQNLLSDIRLFVLYRYLVSTCDD